MTHEDEHHDEPRPRDLRIRDGAIVAPVDLAVISERALLSATHRLTDRADISIEAVTETKREVTLRPRRLITNLRELAWEFDRMLIDETLREKIRQETEPIRAVLIAQAFSRTNLIHPELDESDPEEDPCGLGVPDRLKQDLGS